MAKLYFRYSAMNSGKTSSLIQVAHNYEERGLNVLVMKPIIDTKGGNKVTSRLGIERETDVLLKEGDSIADIISKETTPPSCILIDEANFLNPQQVDELFWITVEKGIPVIAYGIRTDFQTKGFPGSTRLLELAHSIEEMKTICRCGRKAVLNGRKIDGNFVTSGQQIAIDGTSNTEYESLCGNCYKKLVK